MDSASRLVSLLKCSMVVLLRIEYETDSLKEAEDLEVLISQMMFIELKEESLLKGQNRVLCPILKLADVVTLVEIVMLLFQLLRLSLMLFSKEQQRELMGIELVVG